MQTKEILQKIFSLKNKGNHKVLTVCGIKLKIKRKMQFVAQPELIPEQKSYIPYIETHICDHCNLNCKGCGHFSPLVSEVFAEYEQYEKDINELASKLIIGQIRLMGGEPLLHPEVNKFIMATRKAFPETDIRLVTNGILLPTMKENFWQTLRDNNIRVDMSKYPVCGNKFSEYLDLMDDNNVTLCNINLSKKFFSQTNPKGDSNIIDTYNNCLSKHCANLWRSRLYTCPACYLHYCDEYFGTNYKIQDGLDIYALRGEEIAVNLNSPINQCRYCATETLKSFAWDQSKLELKEWF